MATSTTPCGVCELQHITTPSEIWCPECEEGLCMECKKHHSLSKGTRTHEVIPIKEYQKLPAFISDIKQVCEKHNEKYILFCKTHDNPCCKRCSLDVHKQCKDVTSLENIVQNTKQSSALEDIEASIDDLIENIERIRTDREDNLDKISKKRTQINTEIERFRLDINSHLDKLQTKITEKLFLAEDKIKTPIQKFTTILAKKEKEIKGCKSVIKQLKMYATDLQTFLGIRQIEAEISNNEKFIQSLNDNKIIENNTLFWNIDVNIKTLVLDLKSFGNIVVESKPAAIKISTRKQIQAQIVNPVTSFDNIKLTLESRNTIDIEGVIEGSSISPNGMMAFVGSAGDPRYIGHGKVIITHTDGSKHKAILLDLPVSFSWDVTFIDDNTIAVTSSVSKFIKLIDVKKNQTKMTIMTTNPFSAIITYNDKYLIGCGQRELKRVNLSNSQITTILRLNCRLSYVASFNKKIYYIFGKRKIGCCTMTGSIKWTISSPISKIASGIAVDIHGNVFVADHEESSIVMLSPDGKRHRKLQLPDNGVVFPRSVCYDRSGKRLVVANGGNVFSIFKLSN